jgi:hypothetical protein
MQTRLPSCLANLDRGNAMSRHRVGLALPVGMGGRKAHSSAKGNPAQRITSFKIFKRAITYVDSLTLSYRDSVFSFEFAALSYANSHKNRYRYRLEGFDPGWNELGSKQRLATYTNLDDGKYVFRVQGSNSDGIWNEEGVSLPIVITPVLPPGAHEAAGAHHSRAPPRRE